MQLADTMRRVYRRTLVFEDTDMDWPVAIYPVADALDCVPMGTRAVHVHRFGRRECDEFSKVGNCLMISPGLHRECPLRVGTLF